MSMMINTNVASLNAQRMVGSAVRDQATAMERLSSGQRINSAADDAAGLGIANSMTSQIRGLDQAVRNANDGMSMIQTAEGALQQTTNILQRMRELSVQSANGTYNDSENRASLDAEFKQLMAEIDRISDNTEFNGVALLNGDQKSGVDIQVGSGSNQTISFSIDAMSSKSLGMGSNSVDVLGGELMLTAGSTYASAGSIEIGHNDVLINGQSIVAAGGTAITSATSADLLIDSINENVNGVTASLIATAEINITGDGVLQNADEFSVTITNADETANVYKVRDTNSIDELVSKLNDVANGAFTASVNSDGNFVVSAEGAAVLAIDDIASGAIGADTTVRGSVALSSDDGDPITIERGSSGTYLDVMALGFRENSEAGTVEGGGITAASTAWGVGDISINGVDINEGVTAGSLITKVEAINNVSDQTGVKAETFVSAEMDFSAAAKSGVSLIINGFSAATVDLNNSTALSQLAYNINQLTNQTGITATLSGQKIQLEGNASSLKIEGNTAADVGGTAGATLTKIKGATISASSEVLSSATVAETVYGGLKLSSENGNPITIDLGTAASVNEHGLLEANTAGGSSSGASIGTMSIGTAEMAQKAIDVIDNALSEVNQQRGQLGAVSNRLEFTVDNLQSVSQQTSAARSRILDADFASESAALSKSQVLQQAATAMLAQANSAPQQVLSLLR